MATADRAVADRLAMELGVHGGDELVAVAPAAQRGRSVENGQVLRLGDGNRGHRTAPELRHDANHAMSSEPCPSGVGTVVLKSPRWKPQWGLFLCRRLGIGLGLGLGFRDRSQRVGMKLRDAER